ncbi:MAG: hypothetical protein KJ621_14255, partial [Proteobacteria bacterium]|nr:hypothetical protein [Pseudomonadota bacterium]
MTTDLESRGRRRASARRGAVRAMVLASSVLVSALTAPGAMAARDWPPWRPGQGLQITRSPQATARPLTFRLRGLTGSRVLARLTTPLKLAPPTTRLVFKVVVTSRMTKPLTCLRLLQGVVNHQRRVIAAALGPWTCLTPGQSRWLWIEYHPTMDAAAVTWLLERRSGEVESIALDLTNTTLRGKGALLPRVRINDPLPPSPPAPGRRRARPLPLTYRLKPGLEKVHPRLFFSPRATARYRALIHGPLRQQFARLRSFIDRKVNETPPAWPIPGAGELHPWVLAGYRVFLNAGMYRLTGERRYLDAALTWARSVASWPDWGRGEFKNNDLGAAHLL